MAFKDVRRQRFLTEAQATEFSEELRERVLDYKRDLDAGVVHETRKRTFAWRVASDSLDLLILRYTAGDLIAELAQGLPGVIAAFDRFIPFDKPRPNEAHTLTITQQEAYVYVLWLLALCRLLGHAESIPTVMGWLDQQSDFNRGRDTIFERIVEKLTGSMNDPGRYALHPDAYRPLGKAILAEDPAERPALMKQFVEGWYKNMKPCYWHGTHTDKEGSSYFGYWCFEAALVTFLWDIDDSSYRDHLVYPKDLVDFARKNFPYTGPSSGRNETTRLRCEAGQPCPREGWWFTPARAGSRRHFSFGDVMPELGGDYGTTIWQWDEQQ